MFKDKTHFSMHIEELKKEMEFDTYMETIVYVYEHETDTDIEAISKMLNDKIKGHLLHEGIDANMLKMDKPSNILNILI